MAQGSAVFNSDVKNPDLSHIYRQFPWLSALEPEPGEHKEEQEIRGHRRQACRNAEWRVHSSIISGSPRPPDPRPTPPEGPMDSARHTRVAVRAVLPWTQNLAAALASTAMALYYSVAISIS